MKYTTQSTPTNKLRRTPLVCGLAIAAIGLGPATSSASLVIPVENGSFETPETSWWAGSGTSWSNASDAYARYPVAPDYFSSVPDGTIAALISVDDYPAGNPLSQDLYTDGSHTVRAAVSAGDTLSVTFSIGKDNGNPGAQGVAFFDVGGTRYNMSFDTSVGTWANGTWQSFTMTQTISNTGDLSLGFYSTTPREEWGDPHSWLDNVSNVTSDITSVPEPGSLLALGCLIGSGALLRSRRR